MRPRRPPREPPPQEEARKVHDERGRKHHKRHVIRREHDDLHFLTRGAAGNRTLQASRLHPGYVTRPLGVRVPGD